MANAIAAISLSHLSGKARLLRSLRAHAVARSVPSMVVSGPRTQIQRCRSPLGIRHSSRSTPSEHARLPFTFARTVAVCRWSRAKSRITSMLSSTSMYWRTSIHLGFAAFRRALRERALSLASRADGGTGSLMCVSLEAPPNHAFNRTRRYGTSTWRSSVAAGRLTWSCWASHAQ